MINWPTAFVIAIAMICGAFLINKPSDAALGGDEVAVAVTPSGMSFHVVGTKVRTCINRSDRNAIDQIVGWGKPFCSPWN